MIDDKVFTSIPFTSAVVVKVRHHLSFMLQRKAEAEAELERIRKEISFIIGDVSIVENCSTKAFKDYPNIIVI